MYPTVAQVLDLDALRRGRPRVVAGAAGLGRAVRWTHVAEHPDISHLLGGGELLLSTGLAFPEGATDLVEFIDGLADTDVAGLVIELGRRFTEALPSALIGAAERRMLPVIELRKETSFVQVTEAVHSLIVGAQISELRASDEVHRTFTELSIEGAGPDAIVRQTARMANAPVVLESLSHQVLAFDPAGTSADHLLDRWESRSRSITLRGRTTADPSSGWVVATVGARGTDWGRLILVIDDAPSARHLVLAERAAATLALGRLIERESESLERQSHRTVLSALVDQSLTSHEIHLRARGLGVPLEGKSLVGVVVRPATRDHALLAGQARLRRLAESTADSLRGVRALGLVGVLDDTTIGMLLVVTEHARVDSVLDAISTRIRRSADDSSADNRRADDRSAGDEEGTGKAGVVIAAGSTVADVLEVRRSFMEAAQVADVAGQGVDRAFYRLADVGLTGFLHLLRRDERLQTYVERELGPLLAHDDANGAELLAVLRHYLDAGRNKSTAAALSGLSRPAFYDRLHSIERVLGVDLDDVSTCLTLHVAVAALAAVRSPG